MDKKALVEHISKLAAELDRRKMFVEADVLDQIMHKVADEIEPSYYAPSEPTPEGIVAKPSLTTKKKLTPAEQELLEVRKRYRNRPEYDNEPYGKPGQDFGPTAGVSGNKLNKAAKRFENGMVQCDKCGESWDPETMGYDEAASKIDAGEECPSCEGRNRYQENFGDLTKRYDESGKEIQEGPTVQSVSEKIRKKRANDEISKINHNKYWESMGEGINAIKAILKKNGFNDLFDDGGLMWRAIPTGESVRYNEIVGDKTHIIISIYRMASGRYEFTVYLT
jgi:hypothetical protein